MPHENVYCPPGQWTLLTSQSVADARAQNWSASEGFIQATVGVVQPTSAEGAVKYGDREGERINLAADYPGVPGADRLWGLNYSGGTFSMSY